jgi:hypothetical protein
VFTPGQTRTLAHLTGLAELGRLAGCLAACSFDPATYFSQNRKLASGGFDTSSALFHFLTYGYDEERNLTCGPLPEGLAGLRALSIPNAEYARRLFRRLFFAQLRHPDSAERLWRGPDAALIECLRAMAGIPYFVFGDSHASHYLRKVWIGARWLGAMPIVCHGASAMGLANPASRSGYGEKILTWARRAANIAEFDVPIFLKFGGIDAEFLWMMRRIRNDTRQFSIVEFDEFARESTARYGEFLDALAGIVGAGVLRVCSTFPSVLADAYWTDAFLDAHRGNPADDRRLADRLQNIEIPPFKTRTQLRGLYNYYLRDVCRTKGLTFVDDFSPFIEASGGTDPCCYLGNGGREYHLDYRAIDDALVGIIRTFV